MDFLTAAQNASFAETNRRLGLGPDEFTATLTAQERAALPQTRIMSSTGETHFPRHMIAIGSIQEMRDMLGDIAPKGPPVQGTAPKAPAALSTAEIDTLMKLKGASALKPEIPQALADTIAQAMIYYLLGDPKKVDSFVEIINALKFPGQAAVFSDDVLEVPDHATQLVRGEDPVILNYGHIKVAPTATIRIETEHYINSQMFSVG